MKLKGIDGGPHKRRIMWFNSMIREDPYPGSNAAGTFGESREASNGRRRGAAWLSSARAVRCRLKCHNERNPHRQLLTGKLRTLASLPAQAERKAGMTSNQHGPYVRGDTRVTMAGTAGSHLATGSGTRKPVSVRIGVCNPTP